MIIVNQERKGFYNTDKILSVSENSGGISIKTNNADIPVGRYESETVKRQVLKVLENFMAGKFEMPTIESDIKKYMMYSLLDPEQQKMASEIAQKFPCTTEFVANVLATKDFNQEEAENYIRQIMLGMR